MHTNRTDGSKIHSKSPEKGQQAHRGFWNEGPRPRALSLLRLSVLLGRGPCLPVCRRPCEAFLAVLAGLSSSNTLSCILINACRLLLVPPEVVQKEDSRSAQEECWGIVSCKRRTQPRGFKGDRLTCCTETHRTETLNKSEILHEVKTSSCRPVKRHQRTRNPLGTCSTHVHQQLRLLLSLEEIGFAA